MEKKQFEHKATHILRLQGETFPVYHKDRRLYSFIDWKESREKLIKILLLKIEIETGEKTAFIDFKMANPMRKTRLGNFFIDLRADIMVQGKSLGTLEELGMKNILLDSFETLDLEEIKIRSEKEALYSQQHFAEELDRRSAGLFSAERQQIAKSMRDQGWSTSADNRFFARKKRSAA